MTTTADILDAAADLIEPEGAWIKGWYSRDEDGVKLDDAWGSNAVCWCASGAISAQAHSLSDDGVTALERDKHASGLVELVIGSTSIPQWNDAPERTQSEVVQALRDAADLARQEQR